jgi:hypothetical protein
MLVGVALACIASVHAAGETAARKFPEIHAIDVALENHYKVGHWTEVRVGVDGLTPLTEPQVRAVVPDNDGVETVSAAALPQPTIPDADRSAIVYTKVGQLGAPIRVVLADGETNVEEGNLRANTQAPRASAPVEIPATGELVAVLSATPFDVRDALILREADAGQPTRRIVQLTGVDDLPVKWFGYEAVDVLVIVADDDSRLNRQLAAEPVRLAALTQWIELGGRLVILCGGENAEAWLAGDGALASLVPGKLIEAVGLPETGPLENFASSEASIAGRGARTAILVPRLADVDGQIEAYAGRQPTVLPLVVRSARGLGEVAFAGVDLARPPLAEWPGRAAFLQALLRPYLNEANREAAPQTLVARGYNDLSGALRQSLGRSFVGVSPITFPIVTVLAIGYLLLLGPLDYVVVHRWLRRPWAAWITFPLTVMLVGGAALACAEWRNGSGRERVNRLELVDIDTLSGQARGTFWATMYSPRARRFDLRLDVEPAVKDDSAVAEVLLSSWGLPGEGIGGMDARRTDVGIVPGEYRYSPDLDSLESVPVITSATKSLLGRWTMPAALTLEAELTDQDGLVTGSIENRTGRALRNVKLLYNGWGYRLGNVQPDRRIEIGERSSPRRVNTVVGQDALGAGAPPLSEGGVFDAQRATAKQLLMSMMFYDAAGGLGFAGLPNQYQAYCDLSRMLDVGRAVLVADADSPGSRLVQSGSNQPLGDEGDAATVVYRFVLPVVREESE